MLLRNLAALQQYAANWLPVLFNAYIEAANGAAQGSGSAAAAAQLPPAIAAYASIAPQAVLAHFYKEVVKTLAERVRF